MGPMSNVESFRPFQNKIRGAMTFQGKQSVSIRWDLTARGDSNAAFNRSLADFRDDMRLLARTGVMRGLKEHGTPDGNYPSFERKVGFNADRFSFDFSGIINDVKCRHLFTVECFGWVRGLGRNKVTITNIEEHADASKVSLDHLISFGRNFIRCTEKANYLNGPEKKPDPEGSGEVSSSLTRDEKYSTRIKTKSPVLALELAINDDPDAIDANSFMFDLVLNSVAYSRLIDKSILWPTRLVNGGEI